MSLAWHSNYNHGSTIINFNEERDGGVCEVIQVQLNFFQEID